MRSHQTAVDENREGGDILVLLMLYAYTVDSNHSRRVDRGSSLRGERSDPGGDVVFLGPPVGKACWLIVFGPRTVGAVESSYYVADKAMW